MGKRKISAKRGFSFENMPETKLKKGTRLLSHDSSKELADVEFVSQALIRALKDGDADAFKEILGAHLSVTNKEKFSEKVSHCCGMILYLHPDWEFSSAGSEHLPYKQRVTGSNPVTPTLQSRGYNENCNLFFCGLHFSLHFLSKILLFFI